MWLKFVKSGHVGVVATSNDVNFQIPKNESEYDLKESVNNDWKYNSAGIIIHKLGLEWMNRLFCSSH